uniref:Uncharacterized protein n=1 Tax=Ciona intestinalis TaxID=7719 RepID=H2XLU4_CIOIN
MRYCYDIIAGSIRRLRSPKIEVYWGILDKLTWTMLIGYAQKNGEKTKNSAILSKHKPELIVHGS